jgi:DNA-binding response OmpR family regulator
MFREITVREPDLVILDLHLGADDGLDLLRDLRAKSVVPVILITGHRREEIDRIIGLELGADDYIAKPFSVRELTARTRALLRRRSMDTLHPVRREEKTFRFLRWQFWSVKTLAINVAPSPMRRSALKQRKARRRAYNMLSSTHSRQCEWFLPIGRSSRGALVRLLSPLPAVGSIFRPRPPSAYQTFVEA